jgi:uncharacterized protein
VLVPPSQGKANGGRRSTKSGEFDDALSLPREQVVDALSRFLERATSRELEVTFGARGPLLEHAVASSREVVAGTAKVLPVWRRYQGVVWTHLAPETLSSSQRRRILVPSGLYGLLEGEDNIADYRLRMNVRLAPLASLALFWRSHVTSALIARARRATVVNFLPKEHAASIDLGELAKHVTVLNVHFVAEDEQRAVGHDAKAVKGHLARCVLDEGIAALESLTWQGWSATRVGSDVFVSAPHSGVISMEEVNE